MTTPLLSVVVPTRNRDELILGCLTNLLDQSYSPVEIVVLDQSTNDLTYRAFEQIVARACPSHITARYIHSERIGLDAARNDGIKEAKGDLIAFCDDDILVDRRWAEALVHEFQADPRVGMVFGQTRPYYPPEKGKRTRISVNDSPKRRVFVTRWAIMGRSIGPGNNMAISKNVIERVGLFDEHLDVGTELPGGGDYEMTYRVFKHGYRAVYCPSAVAYHKRWLPEDKYLKTEQGYYTGYAGALIKHCKQLDGFAMLCLIVEGGGRLAEIVYHALVTRRKEDVYRGVVRARGFYRGIVVSWRKFDRGKQTA